MRAQALQPFHQLRVAAQSGAALTGGNDLHRVEAEHGDGAVVTAAHRKSCVARTDRVTGVFKDAKAVAISQGRQLRHRAARAHQVHGHKHLGQGAFPLRLLQTLLQQGQADQGRG